MIVAEFKDRLKEIRKKRGLTQAKLAEMLGRSVSDISAMERGKYKPNYDVGKTVAAALSVSFDYLYGREDISYVDDNEDVVRCLEYVRDNPNIRMLFSVTKDATKEDIDTAVAIIKALREKDKDSKKENAKD